MICTPKLARALMEGFSFVCGCCANLNPITLNCDMSSCGGPKRMKTYPCFTQEKENIVTKENLHKFCFVCGYPSTRVIKDTNAIGVCEEHFTKQLESLLWK